VDGRYKVSGLNRMFLYFFNKGSTWRLVSLTVFSFFSPCPRFLVTLCKEAPCFMQPLGFFLQCKIRTPLVVVPPIQVQSTAAASSCASSGHCAPHLFIYRVPHWMPRHTSPVLIHDV